MNLDTPCWLNLFFPLQTTNSPLVAATTTVVVDISLDFKLANGKSYTVADCIHRVVIVSIKEVVNSDHTYYFNTEHVKYSREPKMALGISNSSESFDRIQITKNGLARLILMATIGKLSQSPRGLNSVEKLLLIWILLMVDCTMNTCTYIFTDLGVIEYCFRVLGKH